MLRPNNKIYLSAMQIYNYEFSYKERKKESKFAFSILGINYWFMIAISTILINSQKWDKILVKTPYLLWGIYIPSSILLLIIGLLLILRLIFSNQTMRWKNVNFFKFIKFFRLYLIITMHYWVLSDLNLVLWPDKKNTKNKKFILFFKHFSFIYIDGIYELFSEYEKENPNGKLKFINLLAFLNRQYLLNKNKTWIEIILLNQYFF
ncbi:hypothetical protein DP065_01495 [[Mycoplasma] anseris]|uniref:Uncharacterized protein n=1 Tax=[Mycoplasma] anseris TaxID=92400 RepID=A0A2Z4ND58_9BACT|nr:hypothetical protein DP065_01495 [[Mycoplasma] anseris]